MADNMRYHVFFESNDEGIGYYIGSYNDKDIAKKKVDYVFELFHSYGYETDEAQELFESIHLWRRYKMFSETEFSRTAFFNAVYYQTSGLSTGLNDKCKFAWSQMPENEEICLYTL